MVAKFLDLSNLSRQKRPFVLSNDGRKVWATVLLLSAIMHRKVILVNVVPVFAGPRFVEVQTFCYHGNVM